MRSHDAVEPQLCSIATRCCIRSPREGWILPSVESPLSVSALPLGKCSALLQYTREGFHSVPRRDPLESQWAPLLVPRGSGNPE